MDVAVKNLTRAWLRYGQAQTFICRPTDTGSFEDFKQMATESGLDAERRCIGLDPRHPKENLLPITLMMQADPNIADLAWLRRQIPEAGYALCGVVHTMSGTRIVRSVSDLIIAPTTSSDALICPSRAIRESIQNLFAIQADYLKSRFGTSFTCPVQLPVIPLGIDTAKFQGLTTENKRRAQRVALNVADDELVILFVGRLSFATKTHPTPLLLAAEEAAKRTKQKIRLVLYGYFMPQTMEAVFESQIREFCKTVRCDVIKNTDPRFPDGLWAGADCFVSLVDNIQESFGLTPIEAMACGLPAIVSDWDGYRDGVRHRQDGYLIPTMVPPVDYGLEIAERYHNRLDGYGEYLCASSQSTSIDIDAVASAIVELADNPPLRRSMAASGRQRAADTYDWRHIIRAYEELWNNLAAQRRQEKSFGGMPPHWQAAHPTCPNPWQMFSPFPTMHLEPGTVLRMVEGRYPLLRQLLKHEVNYFVPALLLSQDGLADLAKQFRTPAGQPIMNVLHKHLPQDHGKVWRSCGWLLKYGICERVA